MAKRRPRVTPRGVFQYPKLFTPDTKFNADGVYSVKLQLTDADSQGLRDFLDEMHEEAVAEAQRENPRKKKIKVADPPYVDNEDGTYSFNFKMKAKGKNRQTGEEFTRQPAVFDARGQVVPNTTKVGGGTEGKVSFHANPFYTATVGAGVTLYLVAVQILKLVEWGGASADYYGFDTDEEGFESGFGGDGVGDEDEDDEDGFDEEPAEDASEDDDF